MLRVILLTIKNFLDLLMKFHFSIYIHNSWAQIFPMGSRMGWQYYAEKTLVSDLWFICEFIGNNFTDEFTNSKSVQKKFTRFIC